MSYFMFEGKLVLHQSVTLEGPEAQHLLQSRRINPGEVIELQDNSYNRFQAEVITVGKKNLELVPLAQIETPPESPLRINLFQALIKDKTLELILQKTTELGVCRISLFHSTYSQRLKKDDEKQLARWEKICLEACKQSGRSKPPQLAFYDSFKALKAANQSSLESDPVICMMTTDSPTKLESLPITNGIINLFIGPEGGWSDDEFSQLQCHFINLGQRVLRSETAAIASVTLLQYIFGDLNPHKT